MTPAIDLLASTGTPHQLHTYKHHPSADSYGLEACEQLGLRSDQVFKTLIVELNNGELVVSVLPVAFQLNLKSVARSLGAKKADMADKQKAQRITGYLLGGVSPLAQKKALRTLIDESAQLFDSVFISAGRRGLEIELAPDDLLALTSAEYAELCAS